MSLRSASHYEKQKHRGASLIITIWGANRPYSQLRAELRRTRLQRVREAGMQGRLWLPATSTHYDHGAQPKIESV